MRSQVAAYRQFHGVDPEHISVTPGFWFPGELVLLGAATDTGYRVDVKGSEKEYNKESVHDHKDGVKLYRRARRGELPDKVMPVKSTCWKLGKWLGATYLDEDDGRQREVAAGRLRAISPSKKILFICDSKGVKYVIMGGKFRITDWMYD